MWHSPFHAAGCIPSRRCPTGVSAATRTSTSMLLDVFSACPDLSATTVDEPYTPAPEARPAHKVRRDFLQHQTPRRKAPLFPQPDVLAQGCTRCRSRLRRRQRTSSPTAFSSGASLCAILELTRPARERKRYTFAGTHRAGRPGSPVVAHSSPSRNARLWEVKSTHMLLPMLFLRDARLETTCPREEDHHRREEQETRSMRGLDLLYFAARRHERGQAPMERGGSGPLRVGRAPPMITRVGLGATGTSLDETVAKWMWNRMSPPLPDEILSEILSPALKVKDDAFTKSCVGQTDFVRYSEPTSAYLLVCKSWLRVATPLLYNVVVVRSKAQAKALSMALTQSPILGTFIRRLRIEGGYGAAMKTILASSPNISDLFLYLDLYASDSVDGLCKGLVHVNPTRLILDDHDDRTNSSTAKLAAAVAKMCAASDRLTALQLSVGSTPRLDSIVQSLVERKQLTTLFFSTPSTAVVWYDVLKDCPLQTISIADIVGILNSRRLNNLKAAIGERKIQLNYTPLSPRQTFGVGQWKAGPAIDIAPSLDPQFVPMAGAPQAIQDRVWSLVIDFAFEAAYISSPPHHIARVSKMFARLIVQRAYTDVVIRNRGAASQLARTLRSQPTYGPHIRGITLRFQVYRSRYPEDDDDSTYDEDMSTILANAPNLEAFISSNCDLRGDQYWMSSHIGDLAITWSHVVLAGQMAGSKIKTLCVEVAPRQKANVGGSGILHTAADVLATFTELKSLIWRSSESVELLLDSDAGAGSPRAALPHLEDLTVPGAPKAFFELLAAMELPSLRKVTLPTLTSCYTLLAAHGSQLTELSIGTASLLQMKPEAPNSNSKSQSPVTPVLELCPNLVKLTILCKMPWVTSFVPMPRSELFDARTPASSLLTVTFLLPYNAGTKNNAELWENFFRGFGRRISGSMPSLRTVHFAAPVIWPTTERDIAKSFWVRIAEMLMAAAPGVQVADKNGNKWRARLSVSGRGGSSASGAGAGAVGTGDGTAVRRSTRKRAAALAGED
ncbi:HEME-HALOPEROXIDASE domain-containing protein [Mycena chlorophos]|uniref:HEME-HALOPEROXIDASE domain-containing protein n=1 Tax=Mycena chlorophos TaxID=658473 RepID=A0A8H6TKN3_MYCCL|nr:HEME-HALOPEROXIDASE domain-containing protein [Mycena chlorophos]